MRTPPTASPLREDCRVHSSRLQLLHVAMDCSLGLPHKLDSAQPQISAAQTFISKQSAYIGVRWILGQAQE